MITPIIPPDWPFSHIPTWEYDEDGVLEVANFTCIECKYFGDKCKCIDHKYVLFHRPWFSSDRLREHHPICRSFEPDSAKYPAAYLEWDALGGFDKWYELWCKQWHNNHIPPYATVPLIRASQVEGREHCDDVYSVPYDVFLNCDIIKEDGIHCVDYRHIERSRNPRDITGYKWVHEGLGLWIPWENNKYLKQNAGDHI